MLRMKPIADAKRAELYYSKSDGGYYMEGQGLHREWGGDAAARLGLTGTPEFEQFKRLIHGLDPHSGKQLTALLVENRIPAWDLTASVPKGVTTALERGDERVGEILWEANRRTMNDLQRFATTRVRKGGVDEDRITGNFLWYSDEHAETRPVIDASLPEGHKWRAMPDWDRHIHNVVFNVTFDAVEGQWKAVKFRPVMDQRKYFDRRFDFYVSGMLAEAGYEIETKYQPDGKGGRAYYSWDIKGIPDRVIAINSRRSQEVAATEASIIAEAKARDATAPDRLTTVARDGLGATSRLAKRDDLTLADCREFWNARTTTQEDDAIAETIRRARSGLNPKPEPQAAKAMAFAIKHQFERKSVVAFNDLLVTAMERGMGGAMPDDFEREAKRQGVLLKGGLATTQAVLDQESRVIAFGRAGRGCWKPLAAGDRDSLDGLSAEQQAAVRHVWQSQDGVIMIRGGAGTGKTRMMTQAVAGIGCPVVVLAPSAEASRGVLRQEGFAAADTVAAFLDKQEFQEKVRRGVIWVDEAGLLSMRQLDELFAVARELGARVVLQGDKKQHAAVERSATLQVLEDYAGLPVAELTQVRRQTHGDYKQAVAVIAKGDVLGGFDILDGLGWVEQTPEVEHNRPLVDAYLDALAARKSVLVVAPSHKEIDEITGEIRGRLKEKGLVGAEERTFSTLKALGWTQAERGDIRQRSGGGEIVQFVRNSGAFKAGQRVAASELAGPLKPEHFAVYQPGEIALAKGDTIRITANGRDKTGKHKLNNGALYQVAGFSQAGDIQLSNGWVLSKEFGHLTHGLAVTSHASQGKTVDRVLIAMGSESRPVMSREQFYVSASRGREQARVFTDLSPDELRDAIGRGDNRKSATELMSEAAPAKPPISDAVLEPRHRFREFVAGVVETYRRLRMASLEAIPAFVREKEIVYER